MSGISTSIRGILSVSLPISLGSFVQFIVVLTDNYFLGQVHMNAMNGAGNSALIYVTLLMFVIGLTSSAQIIIARRNGEGSYEDAGATLANMLFLAIGLGVLLVILIHLLNFYALPHLINSDNVLHEMQAFLRIRGFGLLVYPLALSYLAFYSGIARTLVMLYATLLTAGVNILLDYGLIFGNLGMPELGLEGAAWATLAAEIAAVIFFVLYTELNRRFHVYQVGRAIRAITLKHSRRILKVGIPISFQQVLSLGTWTVFFLFIEKLGEESLQSSHIVRNMYLLAFVSTMGISQTTKTYVSTLIAEHRQDEIKHILKKLIIINLVGVFILTHGLWLYPEFIAGSFTNNATVIDLSVKSMYAILPAMGLACFGSVLLHAIEGAGRTKVALMIEVLTIGLYLGATYMMTVVYPLPIYKVWMNDYIYFGMLGIAAFLFLRYGKWREYSV